MKAGIAGEEAPRAYFPSVVGFPKYEVVPGADSKECYIGQDAINKRGVLELKNPVANGIVKDWDNMKKVWCHVYESELKVDSTEQPVLLTEAPLNPKKNRELMIEAFFEQFKVPAFYVFTQAVLGLYASGRTTGCVVDSGDGVTHIVVVYEGYSIKHAICRMDIAGRSLTEFLNKYIAEDGVQLISTAEKDIGRDIKDTKCYVPLDFEKELQEFETKGDEKKKEYEMPDGKKVKLGSVLIRTPECLFQPKFLGIDTAGIHKQIYECIQKADVDLRKELYENITLSGGTTMFEGFTERLSKEMSALVPPSMKIRILAPVERKFSIWIGGSVLSTLATFQTSWITKAEYDEIGPNIVHKKCY